MRGAGLALATVAACQSPPLELGAGVRYQLAVEDGGYNRLQVGDMDCDGSPDLLRGGDRRVNKVGVAWDADPNEIEPMRLHGDYGYYLEAPFDANLDGCDDLLYGDTLVSGPLARGSLTKAYEAASGWDFSAVLRGPSGPRLTKRSASGAALDIWLPTEDGPQYHSGPYALHHTQEVRMADGDKVLPGRFWDYLGHGRVDADDEVDLIGAGGPYAWLAGDLPLVPGEYGDQTYTLPWMQVDDEVHQEIWHARPLTDITGDGIVDWVYRKSYIPEDPSLGDDPTYEVAFYAGPLERGPDFTSPMDLDWLPDEVTTAESWNHSPPTAGDFDGDGLDDLLIGGHIFKGPVKNRKIRAKDAKWVLPDEEWDEEVLFDSGLGPYNKTQLLDVDEDGQAELIVEYEVEATPDPQFPKVDVSNYRDTLVYILKAPER